MPFSNFKSKQDLSVLSQNQSTENFKAKQKIIKPCSKTK